MNENIDEWVLELPSVFVCARAEPGDSLNIGADLTTEIDEGYIK